MTTRLFPAALSLALACTCGLRSAQADIYTWVDKNGTINVSNLAPPDDVQVKKVVKENPRSAASPPPATTADAVPRAEVEFLAARVQQLEQEVALAQRPPPPVVYPSVPAPPATPIQYSVVSSQPTADYGPGPAYGCDPTWLGCNGWWGLGYPASVIVIGGNQNFRRNFPGRGHHLGGNLFPGHRPANPPPLGNVARR